MNELLRRLMGRVLMNQADAGEGGGSGGGGTILGGGGDAGQGGAQGGQDGQQSQGQQGTQGSTEGQQDGKQGTEGQGQGDNKDGQQGTDQKDGEDGQKKDGDGKDDKAAQVPEKYEIQTPEGFVVDPELMTEFEGVAKEAQLTNAEAQKVADLAPKFAEKVLTKQAEAWADQVKQWGEAVQTDAEMGGEKFKDTQASCQKALAAFGTPALKEALESTGMGNHPELVRAFAKIGNAIGEDGFVRSGQGGGKRDPADVMYDGK
jgi:hypothetical protein